MQHFLFYSSHYKTWYFSCNNFLVLIFWADDFYFKKMKYRRMKRTIYIGMNWSACSPDFGDPPVGTVFLRKLFWFDLFILICFTAYGKTQANPPNFSWKSKRQFTCFFELRRLFFSFFCGILFDKTLFFMKK